MNDFYIFKNGWKGLGTVCGWGSKIKHTKQIRHDLPRIIQYLSNITNHTIKINDAGCGDLWWWKKMQLDSIDYLGYDLFPKQSWTNSTYNCQKLNICQEPMRTCDLIVCRDVFIHWPNEYILQALDLFKQSGAFLYSTTYTGEHYSFHNNYRITDFDMHHSKLNLCTEPFNLGAPLFVTPENYKCNYSQKLICLWEL